MRVVVLGGGYAGVALTRRLEDRLPSDAEIVLVDDTGEHLVQHEVHRVIRRPSLADDITVPLSDVVYRADVRTARATGVDPDERTVSLADGTVLDYDVAAICLGSETEYYDLPGVEEHGTPLKTVADANAIRSRYLDLLDRNEGRVVVGGAGLSGVQVAGELAALSREELGDTGEGPEIVLLEQKDSVAPGFGGAFQSAIDGALRERDVRIRTNAIVTAASSSDVDLASGETIDCDQFVWTGGIRGPDALKGDRPAVRSTLELADRTFVLGDAARVVDAQGTAVPATAQAAVREAEAVAESVDRIVSQDRDALFDPRLQPFTFDSPGWVVSVGDGAVAQVGPTVLTGRAALAVKTSVGAGYLTSVGAISKAVDLVNQELRPAVER